MLAPRRALSRLYDHAGIDEPEPQTAEEVTATMVIDASRYPPWCVCEDDLWAGQVVLSREDRDGQPVDVMVTVMGRVVSLDTVRLTLRPPGRVRT